MVAEAAPQEAGTFRLWLHRHNPVAQFQKRLHSVSNVRSNVKYQIVVARELSIKRGPKGRLRFVLSPLSQSINKRTRRRSS
jgi:hypothetical protein